MRALQGNLGRARPKNLPQKMAMISKKKSVFQMLYDYEQTYWHA